jgi:glycosyltransferase involved in cell wall biosynthesis
VRQYVNDLSREGITLREYPVTGSAYPPREKTRRPYWFVRNLTSQIPGVIKSRDADLVILQRQFISTINTFERFTGKPRILDVDDAVWLTARFNSIDRLAGWCDGVVCGNQWLADHFSRFHREVTVVPTAVDTRIYTPRAKTNSDQSRLIGWIGTSGNLQFLQSIEPALTRVLLRFPDVQIHVVSDRPPVFQTIDMTRVIYEPWSAGREVEVLQHMYVGLMPLDDSDWSRGKCSFKMLQYMACGVPAVVSPVGMNQEVLPLGGAIAASSHDEWYAALVLLLSDPSVRYEMAAAGRRAVETHYSTELIAPRLAAIFRRFT